MALYLFNCLCGLAFNSAYLEVKEYFQSVYLFKEYHFLYVLFLKLVYFVDNSFSVVPILSERTETQISVPSFAGFIQAPVLSSLF
jgi:hypothetical protein